jgi:predicted esterase
MNRKNRKNRRNRRCGDGTRLLVPAVFAFLAVPVFVFSTTVQAQPAMPPAPAEPLLNDMVTFDQRSEHSAIATLHERYRYRGATDEYNLEDELFKLIVPAGYDGEQPFGVLVYMHDISDDPTIGDAWVELLGRKNLIFVAPLTAGLDRDRFQRLGLALDALHNVRQRYNVDKDRIYVGGFSEGGDIASQLGFVFGDVFDGAMMLCGTNYFRDIPHPQTPHRQWAAQFTAPAREVLDFAKTYNRYVFLSGENDPPRVMINATARVCDREGFANVTYLDVPDLAHELPPPVWVEQAVIVLDQPLAELREQQRQRIARLEPIAAAKLNTALGKLDEDLVEGYEALRDVEQRYEGTQAASEAKRRADAIMGDETRRAIIEAAVASQAAKRQLGLARNYIAAGFVDKARLLLEEIVTKWPRTEQAVTAKNLLNRLGD